MVKLLELPVNELSGNYLAFNKSVPRRIVKRFEQAYIDLKSQDDFDLYIHRYVYYN
ncbi:hypothetical protein [Pseudoalteromonas sp. TB64]|uniref:hypothetical protein n=1 Tax=Pseudoalteromonas sp. TB64 TaxID=1938600 RepID=UPI000402C154|nr:hypothetical protein [Pseudoalteromonas sp. TB64]